MNERLKELAEQAGLMCTEDVNADGAAGILLWFKKFDLERFAELVRADEREACAALCDLFSQSSANVPSRYEFMGESAQECAKLIRARGNHESLFDN